MADISLILLELDIKPGSVVVEAGENFLADAEEQRQDDLLNDV